MNYFQLTMKLTSALLMVYFMLIMIRILLSWFPSQSGQNNKILIFLRKMTDPYMQHFRNIRWLKFGMLDFSPVLGLMILSFLLFITQQLSMGTAINLGIILVWIVQNLWGLIAFFLLIFGGIMLFRLVTLFVIKDRRDWLDRLDGFLFPRISKILGMLTTRAISYPMALTICAIVLLGIRFAVNFAMNRYILPLLLQL